MKKLILFGAIAYISSLLYDYSQMSQLEKWLKRHQIETFIECLLPCPGDKNFSGHGTYVQPPKRDANGNQLSTGWEYIGEWKNGKFHGKGKRIADDGSWQYTGDYYQNKRHGQGTYVNKKASMIGQFRKGEFVLGYIYFADGSIGFENYGQITPVRDSDKDISKQKKMEALLRASIRLNEMMNAPGYGNVTLGDYARILNEELSGRGGSKVKRKDTDWDWDYLKASREWRCRGIQSGQFANNYNCRNDHKDDDRWPTK